MEQNIKHSSDETQNNGQENTILVIDSAGGLGGYPRNKCSTISRTEMYSEISGKTVIVVSGWTSKKMRQRLRKKYNCNVIFRMDLGLKDLRPGDFFYWALGDGTAWKHEFI